PHLAASGGSIVNFGSGAAIVGQPTQAAYAAAKEAIRGLSRVVANEWAKDDIRVNIVSPMAMTEGVKTWSQSAPDLYQESLQKVPLGRFGDPASDVAPVVAFLLSDDAAYMTGQTLMADGGANKLYESTGSPRAGADKPGWSSSPSWLGRDFCKYCIITARIIPAPPIAESIRSGITSMIPLAINKMRSTIFVSVSKNPASPAASPTIPMITVMN